MFYEKVNVREKYSLQHEIYDQRLIRKKKKKSKEIKDYQQFSITRHVYNSHIIDFIVTLV